MNKIAERVANKHLQSGRSGAYMSKSQLKKVSEYAAKLYEMIPEGEDLDDWMRTKISQCADDIGEVYHALAHRQEPMIAKDVKAADVVSMDVPTLIRIMEYAKEDAETDMDLHFAAERMIERSSKGTITMDDYDYIVGG